MIKRKSKILIAFLLIVMLLNILQIKSLAANSDMMIIKENSSKYVIYINSLINQNFEFAFSNSKDENNLNYIKYAKDNDGNHIAYVDEELKAKFFNSENTYIWVKTDEGTVIQEEAIDLNNAKTMQSLIQFEEITKRITVQSTAEEEKIKINGNESEKYYYQMYSSNSSEKYNTLLNLINQINAFNENTNNYVKIQTYKELQEIYNSLLAEVNNKQWIEANNLEITKPYDAKENQQYILWIKDTKGNVDIQILTAYEKTVTTVTETAEIKEVASALAITYDETTMLCIALGIVLIAIMIILISKKINKKSRRV